jgi:molecular chaperone GrpE
MSKQNHDPTDDIEIEMEEEIVEEMGAKDKTKKAKEELKKAKEEAKQNLDGWQRARADYVNLQKQMEQEKGDIRRRAVEGIILDMLPALDNFDMAMSNKEVWESVDEKWRIGIEYIRTQLQNVLTEHGVEEISQINIPFDPEQHEPLDTIETEDETQDGQVVEVMQKGYRLNGKVIRPAKVKFYTRKED